ncbi:ras-related protein Rap1-like [Dendronephthya gigantea]|uniref:ras-related protein Rap1-like n=1 Tax=Dendronephthya gigantea TaxID=151771 RepID=UPI00106CD5A7|nr:ras-related protein Rap1-like [Dendronephthya gigantea]
MKKNGIRSTIFNYKFVVFGSAAVGKSSLVRRLVHDEFRAKYTPTVEDIYRYFLQSNNRLCNLTIVDTGGTHDFPAMKELYIKDCAAFILVLSVDDQKSFEQFRKDVQSILVYRPTAKILTVVNKVDIQNRSFSSLQVIRYMEKQRTRYPQFQYKYLETSAERNMNVREIFYEAVEIITPGFKEQKKSRHTCTIL